MSIYYISYLKGLIPSFNECVDQFLERLRPLADGKTQVPMKDEFATLTLSIISKVCMYIIDSMYTHFIQCAMTVLLYYSCHERCIGIRVLLPLDL